MSGYDPYYPPPQENDTVKTVFITAIVVVGCIFILMQMGVIGGTDTPNTKPNTTPNPPNTGIIPPNTTVTTTSSGNTIVIPLSDNAVPPATYNPNDIKQACNLYNNCDSYMNVDIPGYGGGNQYAVRCVGDNDYTNTIMGAKGRWGFYKGYNDITFNWYSDLDKLMKAYCEVGGLRRGSYK